MSGKIGIALCAAVLLVGLLAVIFMRYNKKDAPQELHTEESMISTAVQESKEPEKEENNAENDAEENKSADVNRQEDANSRQEEIPAKPEDGLPCLHVEGAVKRDQHTRDRLVPGIY